MKKGSRFNCSAGILIILFLLPWSGVAQTVPDFFEDGDPLFARTIAGPGTQIWATATLAPTYSYSGEDSTLGFRLSGLEWSWPYREAITAAEDIDSRILSGQTLYLITDGLGRRVFEYNANTSVETWSFPPPQSVTNPTDEKYLNKPVDAFLFQDIATGYFKVVITDQDRNRVITVDKETSKIDWKYGDPLYREGSGTNQLRSPEDAEKILGTSEYIIADKGNNRVIIVDSNTNTILWELGAPVLDSPVDIQYIAETARILITDQGHNRVILVDRASKAIVWQFGRADNGAGSGSQGLKLPTDADMILPSQNVTIADAGNERIIEVNPAREVVWQFHQSLKGLRDADRVEAGRTLAVYENYPYRLAYTESYVLSDKYDLGEFRQSVFDSLFWEADTTSGVTSILFQLRTSESDFSLDGAQWYGPTGKDSYYTRSGSAINAVHNGGRWYQFRALMKTNDPLKTPLIRQVVLKHHYYDVSRKNAFVYTPVISAGTDSLVSQWNKLSFRTILPKELEKRSAVDIEVQILNAKTSEVLERFTASKLNVDNDISLSSLTSLKGIQSLFISATLTTGNSSLTPSLDWWKISWDESAAANSDIYFADKNSAAKSYYRAAMTIPSNDLLVDSLYIMLRDPDLEPFGSSYRVAVRSLAAQDSERIDLNLQPLGGYFSAKALPLLISQTGLKGNRSMEVRDRDRLVVAYSDSLHPGDTSADTILVVMNTNAAMRFENPRASEVSKVWFGDTLYIRITNENDRNLNPDIAESISVALYDNATQDRETIVLEEVATPGGRYNSGEFINRTGIRINRDNNGSRGNGEIETLPGHSITATYIDNTELNRSVNVPTEQDTSGNGDIHIYFGREPYVVEIGPNPYHRHRHDHFRLRVASSTGTLTVRSIEIYSLAGEQVREIPGEALDFATGTPIPKDKYGVVENWWDMRNENNQEVASGTYWAKVYADLTNETTGRTEQVAFFRKFVIVR